MPQLRRDPLSGRWIIVATERARRPGNFVDTNNCVSEDEPQRCPLCHPDRETVYAREDVRIIPSREYSSDSMLKLDRRHHGLYDQITGLGIHEIVIETPDHIANMADLDVRQIQHVLRAYACRFREFEKNPSLANAQVYKNHGPTISHSHIRHACSHIFATPVRPRRVKEKLQEAQKYFDAKKRCLYCDLIRQEIEAGKRLVLETRHFIAVTPFAARFLFEVWILPKGHHCDFAEGIRGFEEDLAGMLKGILQKIKEGLDDPAYNLIVQTAPYRRKGDDYKWETLERDYHWHIEIIPRLTQAAGFEKGTGFYICGIPPEDTAEYLRETEIS
jgi:UDPglucose--hexose-1-phosphate uridylyltransferase